MSSEAYELVAAECRKLGFHGVCPEGLAAMRGLDESGFLSPAVSSAFHVIMHDLRELFAPIDDTP